MTDVIEREYMQSGTPAWTLRVRNGNVVASRGVPYNGRVVFSSENRPVRAQARSEYGLREREVIRRYCERANTGTSFETLLDAVQLALATQWDTPSSRADETEVGP